MNIHHNPFAIEQRTIDDEGIRLKHAVIRCSTCDAEEAIPVRQHIVPSPQVLAKWFRKRGWQVRRSRRSDQCPTCFHPHKEHILTTVPDLPRQPTRAERRNIFDEISSCYEEDVGYTGDNSDTTIAERIDVPRKWVEDVREEFFGPAVNADEKRFREEQARVVALGRSLEERALALAAEVETFRKEAEALGATFRGGKGA